MQLNAHLDAPWRTLVHTCAHWRTQRPLWTCWVEFCYGKFSGYAPECARVLLCVSEWIYQVGVVGCVFQSHHTYYTPPHLPYRCIYATPCTPWCTLTHSGCKQRASWTYASWVWLWEVIWTFHCSPACAWWTWVCQGALGCFWLCQDNFIRWVWWVVVRCGF